MLVLTCSLAVRTKDRLQKKKTDTLKKLQVDICWLGLNIFPPQLFHRSQLHHQFANPPADFELQPNDFDVDAELMSGGGENLNQSGTGFVLRAKEDPHG